MSVEAFDAKFTDVQNYFNKQGMYTKDKITIEHRKGIYIAVLATVSVMLLYMTEQVNTNAKKNKKFNPSNKLTINSLYSDDFDEIIANTKYDEFEPFILYVMGIDKKPVQAKKLRVYAEYVAMFVRYIYLLREVLLVDSTEVEED